ncbi:MAG: DNA-primase RepB domain-containing protein [Chloroflexota bacterium]|nr:DNA-primase RepB domain-containing protein [Chloroflexota bacterium]
MCSHDERSAFFDALLDCCTDYRQTCLTLTAIHPDGKHPTPSRHIRLEDAHALHDAFARLDAANALGWGAYFAVGLRRPGLTRWKRGGGTDVVALPALFVDVDDPSAEALARLRRATPAPSCIVASGGGVHAYWWLDEPTRDLNTARLLLRGLAAALGGDSLSVAQSLRVVGSVNTKPSRGNALCRVVELHEWRCCINDFTAYLPRPAPRPASHRIQSTTPYVPSGDLIAHITHALMQRGGRLRGDWVNGACPFPERHKHGDRQPSFGFNTRSGYGFCHVCGTLLLKDLCPALGIPAFDQSRREVMSATQAAALPIACI